MVSVLNSNYIQQKSDKVQFKAGNISSCFQYWCKITSDRTILDIVQYGIKLKFTEIIKQRKICNPRFSDKEKVAINGEISKLLQKQVIYKCDRIPVDFISSIFLREKKDGSNRFILNLKSLNQHVKYLHFKMESLYHVLNVIKPNVWMASVDLKDAFYSIPVNKTNQKYFKFHWEGHYFQFSGMPNGYGPAMRIFTKQLKPVFSVLRSNGHISVIFVDDSYLQGDTWSECQNNIKDTIGLLRSLGFTINVPKSILEPTQEIIFLGFVFNSLTMTISLTQEKSSKLISKISNLMSKNVCHIRDLASLIAIFPAVTFGKLHYRALESFKIKALKLSCGNYDYSIALTKGAVEEVNWWLQNIPNTTNFIHAPDIDCVIHTDASNLGWGATNGKTPTGGRWNSQEDDHINKRELLAIKLALLAYCREEKYKHVRIMCDNTTAVSYINNMGGMKSIPCDKLAHEIWEFCISQKFWLSASHIPGTKNVTADYHSREFNDNTEWQLSTHVFDQIIKKFKTIVDIDLFASRLNNQVPDYISWLPDPNSVAVDAFTVSWTHKRFYSFPPFSVIGQAIAKIRKDKARGIMIIPYWKTQYWFPVIMDLLTDHPIILPVSQNLLQLQFDRIKIHPLYPKLTLLAVHLSGNKSECTNFRNRLPTSSLIHGEQPLKQNTNQFLIGGQHIAVKGKIIHFQRL